MVVVEGEPGGLAGFGAAVVVDLAAGPAGGGSSTDSSPAGVVLMPRKPTAGKGSGCPPAAVTS